MKTVGTRIALRLHVRHLLQVSISDTGSEHDRVRCGQASSQKAAVCTSTLSQRHPL